MSQTADRFPTADEVMRQIADTRTAQREARDAATLSAFVDAVESAAILIDAALDLAEPNTPGDNHHVNR